MKVIIERETGWDGPGRKLVIAAEGGKMVVTIGDKTLAGGWERACMLPLELGETAPKEVAWVIVNEKRKIVVGLSAAEAETYNAAYDKMKKQAAAAGPKGRARPRKPKSGGAAKESGPRKRTKGKS